MSQLHTHMLDAAKEAGELLDRYNQKTTVVIETSLMGGRMISYEALPLFELNNVVNPVIVATISKHNKTVRL